MNIGQVKRKTKVKSTTNIKIDTKINNRQVTIVKDKCNKKNCEKRCHHKRRKIIRKRLIEVHRCVPIQIKCDHHCIVPIFVADTSYSFIQHPSGTFTIRNDSDSCTMKVIIKRVSHHKHCINVDPKSSFTTAVSNLKSIEIECKSHLPHAVCIGTFELDLLFIAKI